jgi:hypothetical protein
MKDLLTNVMNWVEGDVHKPVGNLYLYAYPIALPTILAPKAIIIL